ncbi:MAG TPA: hypothetical protein VHU91_09430 [Mycobacteriales bacterium]|jgi:hypothetical protein|nr:hypothetical protein [Mycobacteriales bacterium]
MGVADDSFYDGIPVVELSITEVDVPDPAHLRRSSRYPGAVDIEPIAAIEAALDPYALIGRDPKSHTGEGVRVIGYSPTSGQVLVVVLLPNDHPPSGLWHVATTWPASRNERGVYRAIAEEES